MACRSIWIYQSLAVVFILHYILNRMIVNQFKSLARNSYKQFNKPASAKDIDRVVTLADEVGFSLPNSYILFLETMGGVGLNRYMLYGVNDGINDNSSLFTANDDYRNESTYNSNYFVIGEGDMELIGFDTTNHKCVIFDRIDDNMCFKTFDDFNSLLAYFVESEGLR